MKALRALPQLLLGETWRASLILAALLNVFFFPYLWGGADILASARDTHSVLPQGAYGTAPQADVIKYLDAVGAGATIEPSAALQRFESFPSGRLPLWNPYAAFGTPLAASMQDQPFYPLIVPLTLHPSPCAFAWFVAARLFIAGLFAFLFLRFFVGFWPAMCGAIAFAFTGYFITYMTMPHVSVEVLAAAFLYATEALIRRPTRARFIGSAVAVFVMASGGMPESAVLAACFGWAYLVFRVATDASLRPRAWRIVLRQALANAAGVALAAFIIAPFLEYVAHSLNTHQADKIGGVIRGLHDRDPVPSHLATYLAPLIYGPPGHNIFTDFAGTTGLHGYFGATALFFAVLAVATAAMRRDRRVAAPEWFFFAAAAFFVLKRLGNPLVNWVGGLPVLSTVVFVKYDEPLLGLSVAMLAGLGIANVIDRVPSRTHVAVAGLTAAVALTGLYAAYGPLAAEVTAQAGYYYFSLMGAVAAVALAAAVAFWRTSETKPGGTAACSRVLAGPLLAALLFVELAGIYYVPMFFVVNHPPGPDTNPYAGAPYVAYLKEHATQSERIFGEQNTLVPKWSEAFGLFDIRSLDALYYVKYLPFARAFVQSSGEDANELKYFFSGYDRRSFDLPLERRLLELASVRYVISPTPLGEGGSLAGAFANAKSDAAGAQLRPGVYTISGRPMSGFLGATPVPPIAVRVLVPAVAPALRFSAGAIAGERRRDRLLLTVEAKDARGASAVILRASLPPGVDGWRTERVDLSRFRGRDVTLSLSADAGRDNGRVSAVWGEPSLESGGRAAPDALQLVYDREVKIYRYAAPLPRAALYARIELTAGDEAALAALTEPATDVRTEAVVAADGLTDDDRTRARALARAPAAPVEAATISEYGGSRVTIRATPLRPSLLLLNDTAYPGWRATVDGRPANIVSANYLFRGVFLAPGAHVVEFLYEPPSYRVGFAISALAFAALVICGAWGAFRRLRARPSKSATFADRRNSH